jgi:hypothetical protein
LQATADSVAVMLGIRRLRSCHCLAVTLFWRSLDRPILPIHLCFRWKRPYSGGPFRFLVGCLLLFGLAFILLAVISVSAQSESAGRKVGALIVIVSFAALWAGVSNATTYSRCLRER